MIYTEVPLDDGGTCRVLRLGVFALDGVGPELPGPFHYRYVIGSGTPEEQVVEDTYDPSTRSTPPEHPGIPENEIEPGTPEWWDLLEFETYKAAIAYEVIVRLPATVEYVRSVSRFIAEECLHPDDVGRVFTKDDWTRIRRASLVPPITAELLAACFRDNFEARYDNKEIFDAVKRLAKGRGSQDVLRQWEFDTMAKFGFKSEEEWADLPLDERVRKVASIALPQLMEQLATHDAIEEAKAKK
jgi:hypothetical protein